MHESLEFFNPGSIAAPVGAYSHAVLIPPAARVMHISGQVGLMPDGKPAQGIEAQSECVWKNILQILATGEMSVEDIVKITSLLTKGEDFPGYAKVRSRFLGSARPASTSYVVDALLSPDWLIEVELIAARA